MKISASKHLPMLLLSMGAVWYVLPDNTAAAAGATTQAATTQTAGAPWEKAYIETRMILVNKDFFDDMGEPGSIGTWNPFNEGQSQASATEPAKPQITILDNFQLNLLLRATQADRRTITVQCPRVILEKGKRATLAALKPTPDAFPQVETRIEEGADNAVRLIVEKVYQPSVKEAAATVPSSEDRGDVAITDKFYPADAVISGGNTVLLPAMQVTFADPKKHNQTVLLILIRVKPVDNTTTRPANGTGK